MVKLLEPLAVEIREASNGQESVEIWEKWQPDFIWMDMQMPVLDGYEATKRIKATPKGQSTIIIAVTAHAFEEEREMVLSIGCDDFVRKPFQAAEIFDKLAEHLGMRYVYEDLVVSRQQLAVSKNSEIENLPSELLADLEEATILCDINMINSTIAKIRSYNDTLANVLAELADNFEYDKLLALVLGVSDK